MSAITAKASRKMKKYAVLTREPRCFLGSFDFSWEQRKLTEFVEFFSGLTYTPNDVQENGTLVLRSSNVSNGEVVDADNIYVNPQVVNSENVKVGDIVVVVRNGSRSLIGKHAQIKAFMPNTVIGAFMTGIRSECPEFTNALLNTSRFEEEIAMNMGATINQITGYMFSKMEFKVPCLDEQKKIGEYFEKLDNLITLHQRKCVFLFGFFQAFISMIFTASTFSWEQRKFSELVQIERGGSPRPIDDFITDAPNGLNWVKIGDAPTQGNYITKTAEKIRPEGLSKTREVHPGDLILSNSMSFGKPYIMGIDGCIHDGWLLIRNTYGVFDLTFLCHLLGTPQMLSQYKSLAAGSTVNNLNKELVGNTYVTIPSITEQRVLGAYLEQLDNLITLHQRECISFTARAGRLILTANKKRNTSSWEQRKFDEVFDCTVPNNTLSRAELSYDEGTVLNVHYGDVLIKYGSVLDVQKDDIPRIPHRCREDFNGALLQDGDVIIADTAEDETTGKACEIGNLQGSAIVSGLHTMVCRPRNRMALGYLGYYLNSNAYHHQLLPLMQGIKVLSLSRSNIQKTSVSYPIAVKEQQLIAYYFSQLDNLITLHQRELEKLQNIKKSMLEKMFV